jgi:hypothetical protein
MNRNFETPQDGADTPGAGRVCETGLRMFPHVKETIVSYDEAGRTLTYTGAGLPAFVRVARNRWSVVAVDDRARVHVEATMELRGIIGRLLAVPLRVWLARGATRTLDDLKHHVERGRPSARKQRQARESGSLIAAAYRPVGAAAQL